MVTTTLSAARLGKPLFWHWFPSDQVVPHLAQNFPAHPPWFKAYLSCLCSVSLAIMVQIDICELWSSVFVAYWCILCRVIYCFPMYKLFFLCAHFTGISARSSWYGFVLGRRGHRMCGGHTCSAVSGRSRVLASPKFLPTDIDLCVSRIRRTDRPRRKSVIIYIYYIHVC